MQSVVRPRILFPVLALLFITLAPRVRADASDVGGRYQCVEVRLDGKTSPCKIAPLVLKSDGSFVLKGREGHYLVTGDWLVLSDDEKRTKAKLLPGYKIVFRYRYHGKLCEVTFQRKLAELGSTSIS